MHPFGGYICTGFCARLQKKIRFATVIQIKKKGKSVHKKGYTKADFLHILIIRDLWSYHYASADSQKPWTGMSV